MLAEMGIQWLLDVFKVFEVYQDFCGEDGLGLELHVIRVTKGQKMPYCISVKVKKPGEREKIVVNHQKPLDAIRRMRWLMDEPKAT